jgi:hypothetical protein
MLRPNGWATSTASEGWAWRVIEGAWVMETVAMPAWSKPRCSSPTDCWQTGQAGTSRARSTCWATRLATTGGTTRSRTFSAPGSSP